MRKPRAPLTLLILFNAILRRFGYIGCAGCVFRAQQKKKRFARNGMSAIKTRIVAIYQKKNICNANILLHVSCVCVLYYRRVELVRFGSTSNAHTNCSTYVCVKKIVCVRVYGLRVRLCVCMLRYTSL